MGYVKLVGTTNPHTNWTTEIVLERDDQGEITKSVTLGEPVELTKEEQDQLEGQGFVFESSTKTEAKEVEEQQEAGQPVGSDVTGAAPTFGTGPLAVEEDDDNDKGKSGSRSR